MPRPFASPEVAAAFDGFAPSPRAGLLALRRMILEEAAALSQIGPVEECLRWGQPAYLTPRTKAATTLRLGTARTGEFTLFVHCRTRLIPDFTAQFPGRDRVEGTRAVIFDHASQIDSLRHGWLIRLALTYHLAAP